MIGQRQVGQGRPALAAPAHTPSQSQWVMKISDVEAAESDGAEPETRIDSEARTRMGRTQVQVDSLESVPYKVLQTANLNIKEILSNMGAALEMTAL